MGARFRSWWQPTRKLLVVIGLIVALVVVIALIIAIVLSNGTGFDGYNQVTTAHTISGPNTGTVIRTEEYQPGRTLWDWLQLLIIPVVLAVGGYVINLTISRSEQEATKQRAKTERETTEDNQREAALQAYIDKMSELLLERQLRESKPEDEVRTIGRVQTLTVLRRLDAERKGNVLKFLKESSLIDCNKCIVDLRYAVLSGANLSGADLRETNLSEAGLDEANLSGAMLNGAKLSAANLIGANLRGAHLTGKADLSFTRLAGANLCEADLTNAVLLGADLRIANLSEAWLREANLSEAYLTGSDLSRAYLIGANLTGVDLSCAKLTDANITQEQWEKAKSLKGATMPDGSIHP